MKDFGNRVATGDPVLDILINNKKNILLFLGLTFFGLSCFLIYRHRRNSVNQSAYVALTNFMEIKKAFLKKENGAELLLEKLDDFFIQNKSSGLAPVFLLEKAALLYSEDKTSESIAVMNQALKAMPSGMLKDLYKIKLCRMMINSKIDSEIASGILELESLSVKSETDPTAKKMVLYFLHIAHWNQRNMEKAKNFGIKFLSLDSAKEEQNYSFSKFSEIVSTNLDLISAE